MAESDLEKTEQPTPRRLREAREEGNVARSSDLTAAIAMLGAIVLLDLFGMRIFEGMRDLVRELMSGDSIGNPTRADDADQLAWAAGHSLVSMLGPVMLGVAVIGIAAAVSQVGFLVTTKPLEPNIGKLNPIKGAKNLVSGRAGMRLVMSLGKIFLIGGIATMLVHQSLPRIVAMGELELLPLFGAAVGLVYALALKLAALLLILAIADYAYQRWQQTQDLRMTKQEVKDEMKSMDGDPLTRQRRARVARQLAMQRTAAAVPQADVIVTNPTHFAIALKYDSETMSAPKVVAKGADFMAMRIRQIAMANGIPLVERKALARALYAGVEVGQEVPPKFYNAVAEILAYVYRLSGRRSA